MDSRCALVSIPTLSKRSCLCLAKPPQKRPRFGPTGSPSANDPMSRSRKRTQGAALGRRVRWLIERYPKPNSPITACVTLRAFRGCWVCARVRRLTHAGSSCVALRAKTKQPNSPMISEKSSTIKQPYARSAPSSPPPPLPQPKPRRRRGAKRF